MGWFMCIQLCGKFFETKSSPQENQRLEIPQVLFEAAIEGIRIYVHNACAQLVRILNEIGINESEDRVERNVTVPSASTGQMIFHGIHRGLRHISVVTCFSAGGHHVTPFFISSHVTDSVIRKLKTERFRIGIDIILKKRTKGI
jgi:hypothetical protein